MFNIGKLRADSVDYYVGGVARTATDYYFGRGEAAGRWAGSLASELSLAGTVDEEHLRRLLHGLNPHTGDPLVSAIGSNARARQRDDRSGAPARAPDETEGGGVLAVAQVAAQLKVSTRAVRHWLAAGERVRTLVQAATPDRVLADAAEVRTRLDELGAARATPTGLPERFLLGGRLPDGPGAGHDRWRLTQGEVEILRDARQVVSAQAGWDLVFRPPKGFSVLWAVGGNDVGGAIHAIHTEAVDSALAYLEDAAIAARTAYHRRVVRTEAQGLVAAVFDHRESRAGDPLLHSHCVVANMTRRGDGRFVALEPRGLYRHGLAADAVYQATFRHLAELRLGIATEPVVHGWADVAGVPRTVVEHFSKRSDEIAAELARIGSDSPQARQLAALATRRAKGTPEGDVGLHDRWRAEADAIGFGAEQIAACLGRASDPDARPLDNTRLDALFHRLAGPGGLTQQTATFTRADVICALATALGSAVDGRGVVGLADRFLASGQVCSVPEHRPGQPRPRILTAEGEFAADLPNLSFTTPELVAVEDRLLAALTAEPTGMGKSPVAPQAAVDTALTARPELDDQQRTMVEAVCRSPRVIRLVVGHPGAGKTYAAEAAVAAFRHAGIHVVGCAVTAEAADELAASTGLGWGTGTCDTLARLLLDLDVPQYGGLAPGAVVLVDEASTLPHRELDRLLGHVTRAGGALVLMGDPKQHGAVGPGGVFAWAVAHVSEHVSVLSANHRQRDVTDAHGEVLVSLAEERLANEEYRAGHIAESLDRRDAAGLVVRAETAGALYDAMASDWFVEWHAGARDPMIATRNSVREELNRRARLLRAAAGEFGDEAVMTAGREIRLGDYVVTRRNDRRLHSPHGTWFVKNGSRGAVVGVDTAAGDVVVDFEGRAGAVHRVRLPASYLESGHVEWAYAVTDYGVQGRTLTKGKAVLDDATRAAGAYVATTRGRLENRIYVVDGMVSDSADPDVSHGRPSERMASMERIAGRLAADEPAALLHERDPHLAGAAPLAGAATLADLHVAADEVTAVLRSGPPDVAGRLAEEERREAVLLARRRVTQDQITAVLSAPAGGAAAAGRGKLAERYRRTLRAIDGQLGVIGIRITELRIAARTRAVFVDATATERAAVDVLHDAAALREATVRLGVLSAPPTAEPIPPPEPSRRQDRLAYRRALERVAVHRDRFGVPGSSPDRTGVDAVALLGTRPDDPKARRSWDLAAAALAATGRPDPSPSPTRSSACAGAEPATGIEP